MTYILIIMAAISCGLNLLATLSLRPQLSTNKVNLRGFIKHFNSGTFSDEVKRLIKRWFLIAGINFLLIYILIIDLTWKTDYNFLIAIYPFFWHYMFLRYFLWEKKDIV